MKFEESIAGNIPPNTHGDILHSPNATGTSSNKSIGDHHPPHGEVGWICPVCGRGLAPSTSYCPCNLTRNITYLNGGVSIEDYAKTNITPPEAYYTTTAHNGEDWIKADANLHCSSGALNF